MTGHDPRIIIATRLFTPEVGAGAFRLQALADGAVALGASTVVLTTKPPRFAPPIDDHPSVSVSRAPVLRDAGGNVRGVIQYLSFDIPLLFRLLVRSADVVVSEPPPTTGLVVALTSLLRRRPFVYYAADVWTHGLRALGASRLMIGTMRRLEGAVLRRASAIISVSEEVREKVLEFGVDDEKVTVVGNGVDTEVFRPDGASRPSDAPVFVYTGTMSEWQGPAVFVEALSIVRETFPDAVIRFFGQGAEEPHIKAVAERLGLGDAVVFGGVISPRETAQWLRTAVAALASIKPGLGYDFARPTKVYAAAACGTPVIFAGSVDGAAGKLIEANGLGIRTEFDAHSIAAAMQEAIRQDGDGSNAAARPRRAEWARANASIAASGRKAAAVALGVLGSR